MRHPALPGQTSITERSAGRRGNGTGWGMIMSPASPLSFPTCNGKEGDWEMRGSVNNLSQ